jgi:hypothetical protein
VLFVNVPIGIVLGIAASVALLESRGTVDKFRELDIPGAVLITGGLTSLVYGIVSTDQYPWGSAHTIGWVLLGIGAIAAFVLLESRTANPLVPLRIFRIRALSASNVTVMGLGATLFGFFFFGTLYVQIVLGFSALRAGFAFLPSALTIIVGTGISTQLVRRVGARILLVIGPIISSIGLFWFSHLAPYGGYLHNVLFQGMVVTLGVGLTFVPATIAATSGVQPRDAGLASGLLNTSRQVGAALGLATLATLASSRTTHVFATHAASAVALTAGYAHALRIAAIFPLIGALAATFIPRHPRGDTVDPITELDEIAATELT